MFATLFRLGPLVLFETGLVLAIIVISQFMHLPACYCYTIAYFALIIFLIEMVFSLRIVKNHRSLRQEYFCQRVTESTIKHCCRWFWDILNIATVIGLLYYSQVADAVKLANSQNTGTFNN